MEEATICFFLRMQIPLRHLSGSSYDPNEEDYILDEDVKLRSVELPFVENVPRSMTCVFIGWACFFFHVNFNNRYIYNIYHLHYDISLINHIITFSHSLIFVVLKLYTASVSK